MLNISQYKHIHCIRISGIGLSAVAEIFASADTVSDLHEDVEMRHLQSAELPYAVWRRKYQSADLIVYSLRLSGKSGNHSKAQKNGIPTVTRAEALGALMEDYPSSIAVSGTHGKTTTTSMVSLILENAKTDPTILVGGNLHEFGGNVKIGKAIFFFRHRGCEYMDVF